jgi:hypothetical protein
MNGRCITLNIHLCIHLTRTYLPLYHFTTEMADADIIIPVNSREGVPLPPPRLRGSRGVDDQCVE